MAPIDGSGGHLAPPERKRFSVVPVHETIEVERPNTFKVSDADPATMIVELKAWRSGPGCPAWVDIQVEAANDAYMAALREEIARRAAAGEVAVDEETGASTYTGPSHQMSELLVAYRCDLLCAVIEGLERHEAALWAKHGGQWQEILVWLGWWHVRPADAPAEAEADPEAEAGVGAATAS
jgi:hypothetical protein